MCEEGARPARPAHLSETCRRTGSLAQNFIQETKRRKEESKTKTYVDLLS